MSNKAKDPPAHSQPAHSQPARLGSAYFLGFVFFLLAVLLWLRGMGRLLLPAALLALIAYGIHRFIQKVREPID